MYIIYVCVHRFCHRGCRRRTASSRRYIYQTYVIICICTQGEERGLVDELGGARALVGSEDVVVQDGREEQAEGLFVLFCGVVLWGGSVWRGHPSIFDPDPGLADRTPASDPHMHPRSHSAYPPTNARRERAPRRSRPAWRASG